VQLDSDFDRKREEYKIKLQELMKVEFERKQLQSLKEVREKTYDIKIAELKLQIQQADSQI
jgi:hypothetical protein